MIRNAVFAGQSVAMGEFCRAPYLRRKFPNGARPAVLHAQHMTTHGKLIYVDPRLCTKAKLQVSASCPMTDAGRAAMNDYLLTTFGIDDPTYRTKDGVFISHERYAELRRDRGYDT